MANGGSWRALATFGPKPHICTYNLQKRACTQKHQSAQPSMIGRVKIGVFVCVMREPISSPTTSPTPFHHMTHIYNITYIICIVLQSLWWIQNPPAICSMRSERECVYTRGRPCLFWHRMIAYLPYLHILRFWIFHSLLLSFIFCCWIIWVQWRHAWSALHVFFCFFLCTAQITSAHTYGDFGAICARVHNKLPSQICLFMAMDTNYSHNLFAFFQSSFITELYWNRICLLFTDHKWHRRQRKSKKDTN